MTELDRQAATRFRDPKALFGAIDVDAAAALIATAADVALVIDADGVVLDAVFNGDEIANEGFDGWVGAPWIETVTQESRPKIENLLRSALGADASPRARHVNHPSPRGGDVPVVYSAIRMGDAGRIVAVGRDLRAISSLQQRLVEAQQAVERDYARLRYAETRYRLLFQTTSEAVVVIDGANRRIQEANPAAMALLGGAAGDERKTEDRKADDRRVVGRAFRDLFDPAAAPEIDAMLAAAAKGAHAAARAPAVDGDRSVALRVEAAVFRQASATFFLARITSEPTAQTERDAGPGPFAQLAEALPEAVVATDVDGRIIAANPAFLDLAQLASTSQAIGEPLERWLGRPGVDFSVLVGNLRDHGAVRLFATILRGEYGAVTEVELSAVSAPLGFGFLIRDVGARLGAREAESAIFPQTVEQLAELVGRVPLKDIVRETTDVIERLCIEAALEITGDNRASAAEMLGLSRQSLYVKLRRYGVGDLDSDD